MEAAGGKIVYEDYYALGASDFTSYLTKIKYANPDVLLTDLLLADYVTMAMPDAGAGWMGQHQSILYMAGAFAVRQARY